MKIVVALLGSLFAVLTTGVLLYVSMTTGLGPWMAPTIVLMGGVLLRALSRTDYKGWQSDVVLLQAVGSTGGAVATAVGFSLPTFYFLQPEAFAAWLSQPVIFSTTLGALVLAAGWWGIVIARQQAPALLGNESLRFPVSAAIFDTIVSQTRKAAAWLLAGGVGFSSVIGFLRDGFGRIVPMITRTWYVAPSVFGTALPFDIMPVSWAIGFLAGFPIVWPLLVGMISKYLVVWPLNAHSSFLPFSLFAPMNRLDFTFAFCSGIVLSQTVGSFVVVPAMLVRNARSYWQRLMDMRWQSGATGGSLYERLCRHEWLLAGISCIVVLSYFSFPFLAQTALLGLSYVLIQHLNAFACRTGLGTYGRYMTFTMVPIMLISAVSERHITLLCMFVGVAGSAAVDMLFSYKVAEKAGMPTARIHRAQLLGLVVTAASIGGLFWLFCTHFQLGSAPLVAHRAQARALLLHSFHFHWLVLGLGALYGMALKRLRINPILAFGGLIMPNQITIGLTLGAAIRAMTRDPEEYTPFWSGVFAGDALWVLAKLL